jgi:AraC-like DNA-binding protein
MPAKRIEILLHLLFWLIILSSINIHWTADWFDPAIRPQSPAPLSLVIFALYFYTHAFFLIPRYFSFERLKKYILYASLFFFVPELLRIAFYHFGVREWSFSNELFSRDSFIFGVPSAFFFGLNSSLLYRFVREKLLNRKKPIPQATKKAPSPPQPYEGQQILSEVEIKSLKEALLRQLEKEEIYLDTDLSLRKMAEAVDSSEKKLSYLINQHLDTNFFELINKYRVERFKTEIAKLENHSLSITGVASNCGFPSKSSFYRAFKAQVGLSPSAYLKSIEKG